LAQLSRRIAEDGTVIYLLLMFVLPHSRFWRALAGLVFLLTTWMPALASAHVHASAMAPCVERTLPGPKSGCDDHSAKALTCGLAMCTAVAIVTASPVLQDASVMRAIIFPSTRPKPIVDATLPPDPFPPRTPNSV